MNWNTDASSPFRFISSKLKKKMAANNIEMGSKYFFYGTTTNTPMHGKGENGKKRFRQGFDSDKQIKEGDDYFNLYGSAVD